MRLAGSHRVTSDRGWHEQEKICDLMTTVLYITPGKAIIILPHYEPKVNAPPRRSPTPVYDPRSSRFAPYIRSISSMRRSTASMRCS